MRKLSETLRKAKIYLLQQNMSVKDLAQKIQVAPNHLHLILSGKKKTSITVAQKIEEISKGELKVSDFLIGADRHKNAPKCPTCGCRIKKPIN